MFGGAAEARIKLAWRRVRIYMGCQQPTRQYLSDFRSWAQLSLHKQRRLAFHLQFYNLFQEVCIPLLEYATSSRHHKRNNF